MTEGKACLNREVLACLQNDSQDGARLAPGGREFQSNTGSRFSGGHLAEVSVGEVMGQKAERPRLGRQRTEGGRWRGAERSLNLYLI